MKIRILLIEDERAIRDMIRFSLDKKEFDLFDAEDIPQAKQKLAEQLPDIILLDWMLPKMSGLDFIQWLKSQKNLKDIPVIMLTAKAEEENKITGLTRGADDYVTKPFSPKELTARVKAILRRRGPIISPENYLEFKTLKINTLKSELTVDSIPVKLSPIEYKLLIYFLSMPNKTLSREQIIHKVWGMASNIDDRTVDAALKRLRTKLKKHGYEKIIKAVRGMGYQFDESSS